MNGLFVREEILNNPEGVMGWGRRVDRINQLKNTQKNHLKNPLKLGLLGLSSFDFTKDKFSIKTIQAYTLCK